MKKRILLILLCVIILTLSGCKIGATSMVELTNVTPTEMSIINTETYSSLTFNVYNHSIEIPDWSGSPVYIVNDNKPFFTAEEIIDQYYESYNGLDDLGRCQFAIACLSQETMPDPNEKREPISSVKPTGWHTVKYPELISDNYLYNRCHLIGWQLSAENANPLNLTTGTRYLNVDGMLPYENMVDEYIENTDHHVMYRVTPLFVGDELVCRGILMEAQSVEDSDCVFCIYCYDVQPGVEIDYLTGDSKAIENYSSSPTPTVIVGDNQKHDYILNNKTKKVHRPDCSSIQDVAKANKEEYTGYLKTLIEEGYTPCKKCNPD